MPVQNVGGWWDQEDFYGPLKTYELLANGSSKNLDYLVVGPWNHGGWFHGAPPTSETSRFASATGEYFRENVMAPWFRYWLHGEGTLPSSRVLVFETGTNQWKTYPAWPPPGTAPTKLYMSWARRLTFHKPDSG